MSLLLLAMLHAAGYGQSLAHPANPAFALSSSEPGVFAPGMRVLVRGRVTTRWFDRCLYPNRLSLRIYSLGSTRAFDARILDPTGRDCLTTVEAVLPADLPIGPAEAILTDDEGTSYSPVPLRIVPVSFALLHQSHPAIASRVDARGRSRIGLTTPATPDATVVLRGAGLGNARLDQIVVELGDLNIRPAAVHPAAGEPGLDEIEFTIPRTLSATGCYVPLRVRVAGIESNLTSLPVVQNRGYCRHRLGLTNAQMETLDAGGTIPVGLLTVSNHRYGLSEPFEYLESVYANSGYAEQSLIADLAAIDAVPRNGCEVTSNWRIPPFTRWTPWFESINPFSPDLDLGAPLHLQGSAGQSKRISSFSFNPGVPTIFFGRFVPTGPQQYPPGVWQLSSEGSDIVQPFRWRIRIPPYWDPENIEVLSVLRSGADPQLRWNGAAFDEGETVSLTLYGNETRFQLECTAQATSGSMLLAVTAFLKTFDDKTPRSFNGTVVLGVSREHDAPSLLPLHLRGGGTGLGLVDASSRAIGSIDVKVQ